MLMILIDPGHLISGSRIETINEAQRNEGVEIRDLKETKLSGNKANQARQIK